MSGLPARLYAVLIVFALAAMGGAPSVAAVATERVVTISTQTAAPQIPFKAFDGEHLKTFDFDGDGDQEIVAHNDNRRLYVFDSKDGTMLAELTTRYPAGWGARPINAPEAAILTFEGVPHIVVANSAAIITVLRYEDSSSTPGNFDFTPIWERRLNDCHADASMDGQPVLHDLDGDGDLEILGMTEEVGVFALHHDGALMWKRCIGGGNGSPAVGDLDFDGRPEVVWADDAGRVTVMEGRTGATRWSFSASAPVYGLGVASIPVGATIGQVDGKGYLDIAFGARDTHDHEDPFNNTAALFVLRGEGGLLWMRQDPDGAPLTYTHPIIHDIDGDGEADVFWADWNTVGHKPPFTGDPTPKWAVTGPAHFYRYDAQGDLRWRTSLNTYWNNKDLALADVDGDGVQEILANGPGPGGDGIWYLDGITGAKETFVSTHPWKVTRGPTVEDMWGTGTMQWTVPVSAADTSVSGGGILVYDTHMPFNAAWPHAPYAQATDGTGREGSGFTAQFTIPSGANEWWVEVGVKSVRIIQSVTVSIDGGDPINLPKTSWGTWAKSLFIAKGTPVVFTATETLGETTSSAPIAWLSGEQPPPPPPEGDFAVTFVVPSSVNNWWVEVKATGTQPVASVTATVDGGTPKALAKTSWGTWAKSFFVPTGSQVVFTATNAGGDRATSDVFFWLRDGAPPPPPPPGDLEATFKVSSSVNQWWVDVKVTANKPITGVDAIVDGGTPKALAKTSWGTWAKSFFVEAGSQVRFEATDGTDTVSSETFDWLVTGGAFDATFKPGDPSNNWWVEVSVKATQAVATVTATVDGGSPRALAKTDWGTWAKSFFVPDGSTVVFTATNGSGDSVSSGPVTWV